MYPTTICLSNVFFLLGGQFPQKKCKKNISQSQEGYQQGEQRVETLIEASLLLALICGQFFCSFDLWDMFEGYNWNRHVMTCLEDFPSSGKGTHPRFVEDRGYIYFLMLSWVDMLNPCVNEEAAMTNTTLNKHWPTVEVFAAYIYK